MDSLIRVIHAYGESILTGVTNGPLSELWIFCAQQIEILHDVWLSLAGGITGARCRRAHSFTVRYDLDEFGFQSMAPARRNSNSGSSATP